MGLGECGYLYPEKAKSSSAYLLGVGVSFLLVFMAVFPSATSFQALPANTIPNFP